MNMSFYRALFQKELPNKTVQCLLCPRSCVIKKDERGFCYGRLNLDGELVLESFGKASGFAVDPIEKKPLYHFHPATMVLSFGTIGCNLSCRFCQNWNISRSQTLDNLHVEAQPELIARKASELRVPSVAFTYNEPIVFAEYAIETAAACREAKVKTVAVTNGYISEVARQDFFHYMDAANVDLKAFSQDFYRRMCGGNLEPVLETLIYLKHKTNIWLEITTLVIPGENDNLAELRSMSSWIAKELGKDVPLHLTAFHPDFQLVDRPSTPLSFLQAARNEALATGLHYVYTGNVHDPAGAATKCPSCGLPVIERDGFSVVNISMEKGCCAECKGEIAGRF